MENQGTSEKKKEGKERLQLLLDSEKDILVVSGYKRKQQSKRPNAWVYLNIAGQLGYTVALPIVGGALLGAYVDHQFSTYPKASLFFLFGSVFLSFLSFIRLIRDLINIQK